MNLRNKMLLVLGLTAYLLMLTFITFEFYPWKQTRFYLFIEAPNECATNQPKNYFLAQCCAIHSLHSTHTGTQYTDSELEIRWRFLFVAAQQSSHYTKFKCFFVARCHPTNLPHESRRRYAVVLYTEIIYHESKQREMVYLLCWIACAHKYLCNVECSVIVIAHRIIIIVILIGHPANL